MSIGDFSGVCRLSVKMLRHYHDIGLLEPALVDRQSGYRYYRFDQVAKAVAIAELRDLDMPLAEIALLVDEVDPEAAHRLLEGHSRRLAERLADAERRLTHIERVLRRQSTMGYDIS